MVIHANAAAANLVFLLDVSGFDERMRTNYRSLRVPERRAG
jgi:hypothetical protein